MAAISQKIFSNAFCWMEMYGFRLKFHWRLSARVQLTSFLHDRPWISPWIKSISNELEITIQVIASQLSGHCDVISNRLLRHQQNEKQASETWGRCVKIVVLSSFMEPLCRVRNKIMYVLSRWTVSALTRVLIWCLFPSLLRNSGNKHQNNPLVSAETVRHSSTYIILYFQHWFRLWLSADQATSHYLNQWWLHYWSIYA